MSKHWASLMASLFLITSLNAQQMDTTKANVTASYQVLIDAPIDTVWKALALDYAGIGKWASGVNHAVGSNGEMGVGAERACEISAKGFGDTKEKILVYEPENYYFEYSLYDGLPGFVKFSINKDHLEEKDGKTLWTSSHTMRVGGFFGLTLKGLMRKNLLGVLENKGQELKHFIETGHQHPNKRAAMAKKEKKQLFVLEQEINAPASKVWKVIADDFPNVSNSHPVSPHSAFTEGSSNVAVGSKRIMYMSENRKKFFVDEITNLDEEGYNLLINVVDVKGYPITFSTVEFLLDVLSSEKSKLTLVFSFQTKPRFLQGLAKRSLKKQLQEYLFAIDHHAKTGDLINKANWKNIRKNYSD